MREDFAAGTAAESEPEALRGPRAEFTVQNCPGMCLWKLPRSHISAAVLQDLPLLADIHTGRWVIKQASLEIHHCSALRQISATLLLLFFFFCFCLCFSQFNVLHYGTSVSNTEEPAQTHILSNFSHNIMPLRRFAVSFCCSITTRLLKWEFDIIWFAQESPESSAVVHNLSGCQTS